MILPEMFGKYLQHERQINFYGPELKTNMISHNNKNHNTIINNNKDNKTSSKQFGFDLIVIGPELKV